MNNFGFIITRHVNSEITNKYWNNSIKLLRNFYPNTKIIIIDDNSNKDFLKEDCIYENIEIIQSEFPGCGELLPYYYYSKNKFFNNAVILHDSIFFHKRINFELMNNISVLPLWFFNPDKENSFNTIKLISNLKNNHIIKDKLSPDSVTLFSMTETKWYGCFGCQSYINHNFLLHIENKYNISNLTRYIKNRADRCCLERIMGCIFFTEYPKIIKTKSILGDIMTYHLWAKYNYDMYYNDFKRGKIPKPIIKVWTGR